MDFLLIVMSYIFKNFIRHYSSFSLYIPYLPYSTQKLYDFVSKIKQYLFKRKKIRRYRRILISKIKINVQRLTSFGNAPKTLLYAL